VKHGTATLEATHESHLHTVEPSKNIWTIIGASTAGTLIEWYDFYIFGSLATIISAHFFPKGNDTVALLSTLATFATGFIVRPFGAIFFGRIGDLVGRKYAFLMTLLLMGGSTALIGMLPSYEDVGIWAPIMLLTLRLVQGLALGGEYGGAAIYVAEHSPDQRRGFYTSFIQTTATLGLLVSIAVIVSTRVSLGDQSFKEWGWRIPFLLSIVLVAFSYVLRSKMQESPLFQKLKASGNSSKQPLRDTFMDRPNRRLILLALFGATAGQGVIWYTGQFYALYFLQTVLKVDFLTSNYIVGAALVAATPFFIVFGWLSDRVGRKPIMFTGLLLGILCYYPIYKGMASASGFDQLVPGGVETNPNVGLLTCLVFLQVFFVTMVYGPIAAFLVELFPTKVRYTSLSVPYHVGNGIFGGLVPLIATSLVATTGNIFAGLIYPISIASITLIVGGLFLHETKDNKILDEN
jgi:MFS family permease